MTPLSQGRFPTHMGTRVTVVNDSRYNAFGGVAKTSDGTLISVYREGTSHLSLDSSFVKRTSTDEGQTWSSASTVYNPAIEVRDIDITTLSDGTLICSFFDWDGLPGGYVTRTIRSFDDGDTWDTPVTITDHHYDSYAATSAPVIELENGDLILGLYGVDIATDLEAYSVCVISTDGGDSWDFLSEIAPKAFGDTSEPNICLLDNGDLLCMLRQDAPGMNIYSSVSSDNGATWSTPELAIAGRNGRPAVHQFLSGEVRVAYRIVGGMRWRNSWDRGETWSAEQDMTGGFSGSYVYGEWIQLHPSGSGATGFLWFQEIGGTNADGFWQRFNDDAEAP